MHDCSLQSKTAFEWRQSLEVIERQSQSVKSSMDLTEWVIQIVAADGLLKSEEQDAILKLCSKLGLDERLAKGLIAAVTERHGETLQPPDYSVGKQWLEAITDIALADGVVSDEEKAVLLKLGAFMDWAEIDVNLLINKRRALL
jgi:tellurite resistance protein